MGKRIGGVLVLLGGLVLTALSAVAMAVAIPGNFSVDTTGLDIPVELVEKYHLRPYVLLIALGLTLMLSAVVLFLAPRKRRIAISVPDGGEAATVAPADEPNPDSESIPEAPAEVPVLVRVFHSRVVATAFANVGGRNRQWVIREAKAGDVVACRSVGKPAEDAVETVGVFNIKGEQMGLLDAALLHTIRTDYPGHRIGITVERVSGGDGLPYTCSIRVGVYRV